MAGPMSSRHHCRGLLSRMSVITKQARALMMMHFSMVLPRHRSSRISRHTLRNISLAGLGKIVTSHFSSRQHSSFSLPCFIDIFRAPYGAAAGDIAARQRAMPFRSLTTRRMSIADYFTSEMIFLCVFWHRCSPVSTIAKRYAATPRLSHIATLMPTMLILMPLMVCLSHFIIFLFSGFCQATRLMHLLIIIFRLWHLIDGAGRDRYCFSMPAAPPARWLRRR